MKKDRILQTSGIRLFKVVSLYNEGLDDLNKFIKYRNKQFQTHNFRQRIEGHDRWTKKQVTSLSGNVE
jgi:hypothetical protein